MISGTEHLFNEDRLRELVLFQPGEDLGRVDLIVAFQYLNGAKRRGLIFHKVETGQGAMALTEKRTFKLKGLNHILGGNFVPEAGETQQHAAQRSCGSGSLIPCSAQDQVG